MPQLEKTWAGACRAVLGGEVGKLSNFDAYLLHMVPQCPMKRSTLSGKAVAASGDYLPKARFISNDELGAYLKIPSDARLGINEIKDIDSLVGALSGIAVYSGNKQLGNSSNALLSDKLVDSSFVFKSHEVIYSKFVSHTYISKYSEYVFGSASVGKGNSFVIRSFEPFMATRLFETMHVYESSDCIYSANLENCQDCLFSFNLRGKRRCIGNLSFPKDKFLILKEKLLGEIRRSLAQKGTSPSIIGLIGGW